MDYRIAPTAREIISKVEWLEAEISYGRDRGYSARIARALATLEGPRSEPVTSELVNISWAAEALRRQVRWIMDEALPLSESQCLSAADEATYATAYDRQIMYANRLLAALPLLEGLGPSFQLSSYPSRVERARQLGVR